MRWLARGNTGASAVLQTVLARAGMLGGNLVTGVIVARTLLPAGRGEQAAIALWPVLFSSFFTFGLPLSLLFNIKRDPKHVRNYFSTALAALFILGSISAVVGAFFLPRALHKYPSGIIHAAQLMMVFAVQILVQYVLQATFEARGRFDISNQLRFIPIVGTIIALGTLAVLHRLNPISAVLCYNLPAALLTFVSFLKLRDLLPLDFSRWRIDLPQLMGFGMKSYGTDLIGTFAVQIEQGLLIGLLSPASMGIFAVAGSISNMLRVFQSSFSVVLMPKATELEKTEQVLELTARATRISSTITAIAAVMLSLSIPILLPLLYGKSYSQSILVARLLMVDTLLQGMVVILSQAFVALGRPATITLFQIVGVSTSAPLLLFLIPRYGLTGAAAAFVFASSIRLVFAIASYPLLLKHRIPNLLLNRNDIAYVRDRLVIRQTH